MNAGSLNGFTVERRVFCACAQMTLTCSENGVK